MSTGTGTDTSDFDDGTGFSLSVRRFITDSVGIATVSPGCLLDPLDLTRPRQPGDASKERKDGKDDRRHRNMSKSMATSRMDSSRDVDVAGPSKSFAVEAHGRSQGGSDYNVAGTVSGDVGQSSDNGFLSDNNVTAAAGAAGGPTPSSQVAAMDKEDILRERQAKLVLEAPMLIKRLQMLERAVQQNAYHRQHLDYRDLPDLAPISLLDNDDDTGKTEADHPCRLYDADCMMVESRGREGRLVRRVRLGVSEQANQSRKELLERRTSYKRGEHLTRSRSRR